MAQCQKPAQAFIRDTFSPCIGVICSSDASQLCQKNHLSFLELLLPFSRLTSEVHIRDPSGNPISLQDFSLQFKDASVVPPQQTLGVRLLNEAVSNCCPTQQDKHLQVGGYEISCAVSTPWFDEYRECFLSIIAPSDHEYLRHFTACVFVVSSSHADPMNQFGQMTLEQHQQQHQTPPKLPKWFSPDILRYYILLHDSVDGEDSRSEGVYQSMKSKYGVHQCHLLKINSVTPNLEPSSAETLPDPWSNFIKQPTLESTRESESDAVQMNGTSTVQDPLGVEMASVQDHPLSTTTQSRERRLSGSRRRPRTRSISERACCLSTHDYERIKIFVHDFTVRALIPWAERVIKAYNEHYQNKKKGGIFKSLFNRARPSDSKPVSSYSSECSEMQMRRLADLCFMFQLYEHAYGVYHMLKKDFEGDKTWMYCAGTQEMAGLSVFMQGALAPRSYPTHYLDGAINVYQTCKSQSFMTRAVLLSTEILKEKGLWLQAATQFLKLTGEELDLRSAVLLEQTAYCYLKMTQPQVRKFAFYMVLAGHRYSKASQRPHAHRCYTVALQVYENKDWTLAENHIGLTISRLCGQMNMHHQALFTCSRLMCESSETVLQQSVYLREYLQLYQTLREEGEKCLPDMCVPVVVNNEIMVTTDQFDMHSNSSVYSDDKRWGELEEACVAQSQGSIPLILQRSIPSYNRFMTTTQPPRAVLGEMQFIRVMIRNPLKIPLTLTNVSLEWRFKPDGQEEYSLNSYDNSDAIDQTPLPLVELPGLHKQWILLRLIPKTLGLLNIQSIRYNIHYNTTTGEEVPVVEGRVMLNVQGPRLNNTLHEKNSVVHAMDMRLSIKVLEPMPKIKVVFESFPTYLQCGQLAKVPVTVTNSGPIPLRKLHMACNEPDLITIPGYTSKVTSKSLSRKVIALDRNTTLLKPCDSMSFDVWLRAEDSPANRAINFLFYYESDEIVADNRVRHRCSRYSFVVKTLPVLRAQCNTHIRTVQNSQDLGSYLAAIMLHNCALPSSEAVLEFSISDVLCKSKSWKVTSLECDASSNIKVNQSEVALLDVYLKHVKQEENYSISQIQLSSERVDVPQDVIDGFLTAPLYKPAVHAQEEETDRTVELALMIGILWKGYRIDMNGVSTQTIGLHYLPITVVNDETMSRSSRAPSISSHYAVLEIPRKTLTSSTSYEPDASQGIEYQLVYSSHIKADLSFKRACVVPVTLIMKSYAKDEVSVSVTHVRGEDGLVWSGKTCTKVKVPAHEMTSLQLKVTVFSYGVYNLNTLSVIPESNCFVREQCSEQTLLVVDKS